MKISKQLKEPLEIPSFHTILPKIMIIGYTVPEIWHVTDVIVIFHFAVFFFPFTPNSLKNENFKKIKKTLGDIVLHKCTQNHDPMLYCS